MGPAVKTTAVYAPTESDLALDVYIQSIAHDWSKTLALLGITLIPVFFILDYFMMPAQYLNLFAGYRLATTCVIVAQYVVLRHTRPSRWSFFHGYFFSFVAGGMI